MQGMISLDIDGGLRPPQTQVFGGIMAEQAAAQGYPGGGAAAAAQQQMGAYPDSIWRQTTV